MIKNYYLALVFLCFVSYSCRSQDRQIKKQPAAVVAKDSLCKEAFLFDNRSLKFMIDEMGSYYHLEVIYMDTLSAKTYFSTMSKCDPAKVNLSFVSERTGIPIKINGDKIIVGKN